MYEKLLAQSGRPAGCRKHGVINRIRQDTIPTETKPLIQDIPVSIEAVRHNDGTVVVGGLIGNAVRTVALDIPMNDIGNAQIRTEEIERPAISDMVKAVIIIQIEIDRKGSIYLNDAGLKLRRDFGTKSYGPSLSGHKQKTYKNRKQRSKFHSLS